ncbi:DUF4239 domain-containing protein [Rhodoplanes roseus]|uniref:DUF4239 domain-containing protein n=1 Tax=Rhodoplanes roseus TaxID=29409 RepID=A0A327KRK6_9BRAD|nr:DUF4239 domain-containing protein [Rhodoplanes roseus]RAI40293.1 hypothetical protein CH341_24095 [Rhodoplanes roseus]
MINGWLTLPAWALFGILVAFYTATAALIAWLVMASPVSSWIKSFTGVVAPFIAAVSVLFSLLTGFLAGDIADRNRQAWRAVNGEASAIVMLNTLSLAAVTDMSAIRAQLKAYTDSVLKHEWAVMAEGRRSPATGAALRELLRHAADPAIARDAGQTAATALLNAVIRIRDARAERLALASDQTNDIKWLTVLALGIVTQIAVALVHLDKPRAKIAAMAVFTLGAVIALGLVALQEYPFSGDMRVSPVPIERAAELMAQTG